MDALPCALCTALLCPFVPLRDRVHALAHVSRRWRQLAWRSIRSDRSLDLTWCTGNHELGSLVTTLAKCELAGGTAVPTMLEAFRLYGPRVDMSVLQALIDGVGYTRVKRMEIESKQIDDDALRCLSACTELETLTLHCVKLTSQAVAPIARACTKLQSLNLAGCSRVCDAGVIDVATHCSYLQEIDLTMCRRVSDRSLAAIGFRTQKTLVRVVVDRCLKISGLAIRFLMKSQPRLRDVSFAHCPRVHDRDFIGLHKQFSQPTSQFESIDMSGCASVSDAGLALLLHRNSATLRCLQVRALLRLSSVAYQSIAHCEQLTDLNLSMNRTLQNADLRCIVTACTALRSLQLQGCVQIDDDGAAAIACYGRKLQVLSLEFCYNITDDGITQIVSGCHQLEELNLKALNQLTLDAFDSVLLLKSSVAMLRRINIGAIADFQTTLQIASIIKRRYPRARIEWT